MSAVCTWPQHRNLAPTQHEHTYVIAPNADWTSPYIIERINVESSKGDSLEKCNGYMSSILSITYIDFVDYIHRFCRLHISIVPMTYTKVDAQDTEWGRWYTTWGLPLVKWGGRCHRWGILWDCRIPPYQSISFPLESHFFWISVSRENLNSASSLFVQSVSLQNVEYRLNLCFSVECRDSITSTKT